MEKLSENEIKMLSLLVENGRASDIDISESLGISPQAVGKIRKKLETENVIEGYCTNLNLEKLGINIFALFKVNFTPKFWESHTEDDIKKTVFDSEQIICSGRLINAKENLFSIAGFRNQDELEEYLKISMSKFKDFSKYEQVDVFSAKSLIKMDKASLYTMLLRGNLPSLAIKNNIKNG